MGKPYHISSKTRNTLYGVVLLVLVAMLGSCSSARYVPKGEYLLKKNEIKFVGNTNKELTESALLPYLRQKPNRSMIFGMKFYLSMYNASPRRDNWLGRTLKSGGEPPVVFDVGTIDASIQNLTSYLESKGYYYSVIADTVFYRGRKATVQYTITPKQAYRVRNIGYIVPDTSVLSLLYNRRVPSDLRSGRLLDIDALEAERTRITSFLRNNGYYAFNKMYIDFDADTTIGNYQADLNVHINKLPVATGIGEQKKTENHKVYRINNIYVRPNYNPVSQYIENRDRLYDTIAYKNLSLIYDQKRNVNPKVIDRANLMNDGALYRQMDATRTYNNFANLRMYRSVSVDFRESGEETEEGNPLLDCYINLTPAKLQGYKIGMGVSSNSEFLLGFSPSLGYYHNNLFKGAEYFSVDFSGLFQYQVKRESNNPGKKNSIEYSLTSTLNVPKMLFPIQFRYFKTHMPHTVFSASYAFQRRPEYTRNISNASAGFEWKTSRYTSFLVNPIDMYVVKMSNLDSAFYQTLADPYLKNSYQDHFLLGSTASLIYSTREVQRNNMYFRLNTDLSGNLLSLFRSFMKKDSLGERQIGGMQYGQYAKMDATLTFNTEVTKNSTLVCRLYGGVGKAYGNSIALPYEKMFYGGGANSMRGWQVREIGPGSAQPDNTYVYPNQVADMRLEANLEYRFKMLWILEGALFADLGNIWSLSKQDKREGAQFKFNRFYKDFGFDTGFGFRFDLSFFTFRVDLGMRMYDPALQTSSRFVPFNRWLSNDNYSIHLGIGYPF